MNIELLNWIINKIFWVGVIIKIILGLFIMLKYCYILWIWFPSFEYISLTIHFWNHWWRNIVLFERFRITIKFYVLTSNIQYCLRYRSLNAWHYKDIWISIIVFRESNALYSYIPCCELSRRHNVRTNSHTESNRK